MKIKLIYIFLIILFFLFLISGCKKDKTGDKEINNSKTTIKTDNSDSKTFIVGVENLNYYPILSSEFGDFIGYSRELLDEFAKTYGYTFNYQILPVKRLYDMFLYEELDLKFPDNQYWQKDLKKNKNIAYSEGIVNYIDGVFVLPENKGKGILFLKKLGTIMGFTPQGYLEKINNGQMELYEKLDIKELINQGINNQVDGIYCNVVVTKYIIEEKYARNKLVFDHELPYIKSSYKLSSIKYPEIIDKMNEFLIEKKDFINNLKNKYNVEAGIIED